jgi:hypothetical protein
VHLWEAGSVCPPCRPTNSTWPRTASDSACDSAKKGDPGCDNLPSGAEHNKTRCLLQKCALKVQCWSLTLPAPVFAGASLSPGAALLLPYAVRPVCTLAPLLLPPAGQEKMMQSRWPFQRLQGQLLGVMLLVAVLSMGKPWNADAEVGSRR